MDAMHMKAGDSVDTALCGEVTLLRRLPAIPGWEVRRSDGRLAYMAYADFDLTDADIAEIRQILRDRCGAM